MTLDEAIKHAEDKAQGDTDCAGEHRQLAVWLCQLRDARLCALGIPTIDQVRVYHNDPYMHLRPMLGTRPRWGVANRLGLVRWLGDTEETALLAALEKEKK